MKNMESILNQELQKAFARREPVTMKDIEGKNPLNVLSELVKAWPLQDQRLNADWKGVSTDPIYIRDMARGLKLKVASKDYEKNSLKLKVLALSNLAEYERFNVAANAHNERYLQMGAPDALFDPLTGAAKAVDGLVGPAIVPNEHDEIPTGYQNPLHKGPEPRRYTILGIEYRIVLQDDVEDPFRLEYVVEDSKGQVVLYNTTSGYDLAKLVQRSVQLIWGNPTVSDMHGNLYEGIPMLVQGKKLRYCGPAPIWMRGKEKTTNPELFLAETKETGLKFVALVTGYILPFLIAIWMIGIVFNSLGGLNPVTEEWAEGTESAFLWGMGLVLGVLWLTFKVAEKAHSKAAQINMQKNFL